MRPTVVLLSLAGSVLLGQTPTLRTTVHLVVAPTTVTDRSGGYVSGLGERDFRLYDNGKLRDIRVDVTYIPISLIIAVQSSSFSAEALNKVRRIGSMIEPLVTGERGEVAVIAFDSGVRVLQKFTSNFDDVHKALGRLGPGDEGAKMIDAVAESVRLLAARPLERRRVLLVFGETRDRSSKLKLEDVITRAEQENVTIYPVTYSAYLTSLGSKPGTTPPPDCCAGVNIIAILREIGRLAKTNTTEALSTYTGGRHLSFARQKSLEQSVARIGEELHSQYLLSFQAGLNEDAVFHSIEVRLPERPELSVRTRPGYWMTAGQP